MPLTFPNVPSALGVPPLPRSATAPIAQIALLEADLVSIFSGLLGQQWGIFRNNNPVVLADSVVTFDFKKDWNIPTYPVEANANSPGTFESYDKVELPYETRLRFATGGNETDREVFIKSIANIAGDFNLYDVVSPEATYFNANITHYEYHRSSGQGVGVIVVDVWLQEIRVSAQAAFSNTQQPSAANPQNSGTIQPITPTPAEQSSISSGLVTSGQFPVIPGGGGGGGGF